MSGAILSAARSVLDLLVTINKTNHVINQKISHTKTYMHYMTCHLVKLTWCFSAFSLSSMKDWCSDREFGLNMISYCLLWIQRTLESNADGSGLCLPGSTLRWNQDGSQKKMKKTKHKIHSDSYAFAHSDTHHPVNISPLASANYKVDLWRKHTQV